MPRDVWGSYISPGDYDRAAAAGICEQTVKSRLLRGWKVEKAITVPVIKKRKRSEEYEKYKKLAEENGINKDTYKCRVQRGWTYKAAATLPLVSSVESIAKINKKKERTIPEHIVKLAKSNGICYSTLRSRIQMGVQMNEAATKPVTTSQRHHPWRRDIINPWNKRAR